MIDVHNRRLFTPFTHPESGVTFYVLTRKVAPVQQGFYFVNDSMSADGRYLWFYCAFPPSGTAAAGRTLGVADFLTGEVRHFPETQFGQVSPCVDVQTGECTGSSTASCGSVGQRRTLRLSGSMRCPTISSEAGGCCARPRT